MRENLVLVTYVNRVFASWGLKGYERIVSVIEEVIGRVWWGQVRGSRVWCFCLVVGGGIDAFICGLIWDFDDWFYGQFCFARYVGVLGGDEVVSCWGRIINLVCENRN